MDDFVLEKKSYRNKKKSILLVLSMVLVLGVSMAAIYYVYYFKDRENDIQTGLISIDYSNGSAAVVLNNAVPVIDEVGLENTPFTFTITNTSSIPINAKVTLTINDSTTIDVGGVRYAVYINNQLMKIDNVSDDLVLYTYTNMAASASINCKLVFWVDYYYDEPGKIFSAKINAEGESFDYIVTP